MDEFNIENSNNYLSNYTVDENEIFSRYMTIVNEFLTQTKESIKPNNDQYFLHIIITGVETITHVYRLLLLYTKNSELVCYNCKKSVYYYIEFICHLSTSNCAILKLTVKDASLFVYRKTVFAINQTFRKDYKQDERTKLIGDNIFCLTEIFLSCFKNSNTISIDTILIANNRFAENMTYMFKKTESKNYNKKLNCILKICDCIDNDKYEIISFIIRKITKKDIELSSIRDAVVYAVASNTMTNKQFADTVFSKCVNC